MGKTLLEPHHNPVKDIGSCLSMSQTTQGSTVYMGQPQLSTIFSDSTSWSTQEPFKWRCWEPNQRPPACSYHGAMALSSWSTKQLASFIAQEGFENQGMPGLLNLSTAGNHPRPRPTPMLSVCPRGQHQTYFSSQCSCLLSQRINKERGLSEI